MRYEYYSNLALVSSAVVYMLAMFAHAAEWAAARRLSVKEPAERELVNVAAADKVRPELDVHPELEGHRQPGMIHVHFLGADALSFGHGIRLEAGDVTEVTFERFGRPLVNTITVDETLKTAIRVKPMQ